MSYVPTPPPVTPFPTPTPAELVELATTGSVVGDVFSGLIVGLALLAVGVLILTFPNKGAKK